FWFIAMAKTINGEAQLQARVDGKKIIIIEASIRRDLQIADEEGFDCLPNSIIFEQLALMRLSIRSWVRAVTTASSLRAEQDSDNIAKTQSKATPNESSSQWTDSGGDPRVESLDDEESLGEDASKQGRIKAIDAYEDITLVNDHDDADKDMFDVNVLGGEEVFAIARQKENVVNTTTEELTLAQALEALKTSKPKVKGLVIQEPCESTTTIISSQQSHDKGKGIIIENL
nr:hypothetical protein [Tanacetum cinerariifolium]